MQETTFAPQQFPSNPYAPMSSQANYQPQVMQPVIATAQFDLLWMLLIPLVFFIAPFGAVALIIYFLGRAVRASPTLQVITVLIVLSLFVQYVLIPFLIDL